VATPAALAKAVGATYAEAEQHLANKIARRAASGFDTPGWADFKLAQVGALRRDLEGDIVGLASKASAQIDAALFQAYGGAGIHATLQSTHSPALRALRAQTLGTVQSAHNNILRSSLDAYRQVVSETTQLTTAGVLTHREALQRSLNQFADQGITSFVDKAGRRWSMDSYAEMATRTGTTRAHLEGKIDTARALGFSLFIMSGTGNSCPICAPWQGMVLSAVPSRKYRTIAEAKGAGVFHANCGHTLDATSEEGLATGIVQPTPLTPEELAASDARYADAMHQRYLESQLRSARMREAVAFLPQAQALAAARVASLRARLDAFTTATGRRRYLHREYIREGRRVTSMPPGVDPTRVDLGDIKTFRSEIPGRGLQDAVSASDVDEVFARIFGDKWQKSGFDMNVGGLFHSGTTSMTRAQLEEFARAVETVKKHFPDAWKALQKFEYANPGVFGAHPTAYAHVAPQGGGKAIMRFNKHWFNDESTVRRQIKSDINQAWHHGQNADHTWAEVFYHEFGHVLDNHIKKSNFWRTVGDDVFPKSKHYADKMDHTFHASRYGATSPTENFAEAFSYIFTQDPSKWSKGTQAVYDWLVKNKYLKPGKSKADDVLGGARTPTPRPTPTPQPVPGTLKELTNRYNNLSSKISRGAKQGASPEDLARWRLERDSIKSSLDGLKRIDTMDFDKATSRYNVLSSKISRANKAGQGSSDEVIAWRAERELVKQRLQALKAGGAGPSSVPASTLSPEAAAARYNALSSKISRGIKNGADPEDVARWRLEREEMKRLMRGGQAAPPPPPAPTPAPSPTVGRALSEAERKQLYDYQTASYNTNMFLRNKLSKEQLRGMGELDRVQEQIRVLDDIFANKAKVLEHDITLYRGVPRSVAQSWEDKYIKASNNGQSAVIKDKSFVSTSTSKERADFFAGGASGQGNGRTVIIKVPKGTKVVDVEKLSGRDLGDGELLLPRGMNFSISIAPDRRTIVLTVVP
jgi:hypothetical protein